MKSRLLLVILAGIYIPAMTGCATSYPLGLTKSEWDSMPPEKQAEYRTLQRIKEKQAEVDARRPY